MNKLNSILYAISALLLLNVGMISCSWEEEIRKPVDGNSGYITLQLNSSAIDTRATEPGVDSYNENLLLTLDCFFYPTGKTGEKAKLHKRVTLEANTNTQATVQIPITTTQVNEIFPGGTASEYAVIYAIANLPTAVTLPDVTSIDNLKAMELTADFVEEKNDQFVSKKQDSFVMDGKADVTLVRANMAVTGTVELKRAASKIELYITEVVGTATGENEIQWISNPAGMTVSFYKGVKRGLVDGKINTLASSDYFDATRMSFDAVQQGGNPTGHYAQELPFYSYSSDWEDNTSTTAYMTLEVPWQIDSDKDGVPDPGAEFKTCYYMVPLNLEGMEFVRNTYYRVKLAVRILGSFVPDIPIVLDPSYVIVDWGTKDINTSLEDFKYLVVDEKFKEFFNKTTCTIGYSSSSAITVTVDSVTYPSYTTGKYVGNKETSSKLNGYTIPQNEITNNTFTLHHLLTDVIANYVPYTIYLTVKNEDGMEEKVTMVQYPSLYMSMGPGDDIFVNGYFARVKDATMPGAIAYAANASNGRAGRYYSFDHNSNGNSGRPTGDNLPHVKASYGNVYSFIANEELAITGTTNVYVTAFNESNSTYKDGTGNNAATYTYRIGDPRVASGWNNNTDDNSSLARRLTAQTSNSRTRDYWSDASQIQVATTERNIIAPAYKISSAYALLLELTYDSAKKRCATYQEAGYPAGRWRLPTEAEIMFVRNNLQANGKIPNLFVPTARYWASSGRYVNGANISSDNSNDVVCRCVYDIWYWGDEAKAANTYHATEVKQ